MANQKVSALTIKNIAKITDLIYVVTYDDDEDYVSVAMNLQDLLASAVTGVNRIISGQVIWTGVGFVHKSVNLSYEINRVIYFSNDEPITNADPDGSDPRFDVIFVDADGLDIQEGTPAGSPTVPSLDNPTDELATNIVLVTNGETTPTGVSLDALYSENLQESGGEYDTFESTSGARIDISNAVDPINLVVDIKATSPNALDYFNLNHSVATQIEDFQNLRFKIKSLSNWKRDYIRIDFFDGVNLAGYTIINSGFFDTTDTSTIVDLFIAYGNVAWTLDFVEFDAVRFSWVDGGGGSAVSSARCQIDLIKMETGGISTKPKPSLTMDSMANMTNSKTTPVDADNLTLWDSVAEQFKQVTWANVKSVLLAFFDTKYKTHTGEVTGEQALSLDKTAISNQDEVSTAGGDHLVIVDASDSGNLKKVLASDLLGGGGDMLAATYDPTTVGDDAFDMDNMAEASTGKTTPIDADTLSLWDSVASVFKKLTWANLKATLKTYFDTLYSTLFGTIIIYNVKDYGALGDGVDLLDGAITVSDATFTSASNPFVSGDVGKVIAVEGAGTAGAYHVTTIASYTSAGEVELTDNAVGTVSGSNFYFGTDDTDDIQDTIQAAFDAGGGKVYVPRGIHIIDGPLLNSVGGDNINYNSQLYIPGTDLTDAERTTIEIEGEFIGNTAQSGPNGPITASTGSCLRSTIQGSGTFPSVIANDGAAGWVRSSGWTTTVFKNLNIQVTVDGNDKVTMSGINCLNSSVMRCEGVICFPYAVDFGDNSGKPDVINVGGIIGPKNGGEHISTITACYVGGFTYGYLISDHMNLHESSAICCTTGLTFRDAGQTCGVTKMVTHWCIYDIGVINTVTTSNIFIQHMQVEVSDAAGDWFDTVATINDPSHYLRGKIDYLAVFPYDGSTYVKIGGQYLAVTMALPAYRVNLQTGTTYTPTILDAFRITKLTNASSILVTIPPYTDLNFDFDTRLDFYQGGAGQVTFVGGVGVTINTAETLLLRNQYSACALIKEANNVWLITGDIELV